MNELAELIVLHRSAFFVTEPNVLVVPIVFQKAKDFV
jgi:hypothetical protein